MDVTLGFVFVFLYGVTSAYGTPSSRERATGEEPMAIEYLISGFGYPVENHVLLTEDGYILNYHRIPRGRNSSVSTPGRPVLLQHGLFCASTIWVMSTDALAYLLADAGYDVWLGNARGNTYSRRHVSLDPDTDYQQFWDYSWHEMGYYDLPAAIDYILQETGKDQLFYIGHSMGTTMYFVLGSTRPEYMAKVRAAILLAPVAFPYHLRQEEFLSLVIPVLNWVLKDSYEVLPLSPVSGWMDEYVCADPLLQAICRDVLFACSGYDEAQLNRTLLPTILQYLPAGASRKELTHYGQITMEAQGFRQYNYGLKGNLWRYGSPDPPDYNLSLVTSPLYLFYGQNDWAATPQDVLYAADQLPNVKQLVRVPYDLFNHIDFLWAVDAKSLLYDGIVSTLQCLV